MAKPVLREDYGDLRREDVEFLKSRGIGRDTARFLALASHDFGLAFPYGSPEPEGFKVRATAGKRFIVTGKLSHLFNIERVTGDTIIITEGEIDAASLVEAGFPHATSIPHGASQQAGDASRAGGGPAFAFLHADEDRLKQMTKVILCLDNDDPGRATQAEIARRLGRARCYEVTYPSGCKDANDVLMRLGRDALVAMIESARPMYIPGLQRPEEFRNDLLRIRAGDLGKGYGTGLYSLDRFFSVAPGNWTCVTGHPGSGKTELVDQIAANIAEREGWQIAYCSMENTPAEHVAKLIEKRVQRRFHPNRQNRMTDEEMEEGFSWVQNHFHFLTDEEPPTIESILDRMTAAVMRHGVKMAVIDPFNYVKLPGSKRDDLEISEVLSKISTWVKSHEVALFFVAHPRKMPSASDIPDGTHVAGSASWWAKADFGMSVHREDNGQFVTVKVWKVRRGHLGATGMLELGYNVQTACYYDLDEAGIAMRHEAKEQAIRRDLERFRENEYDH